MRIILIDNQEWFVGKDVCKLLGYKNETDAMNRHCKGVVKRYPLLTSGGYQELRVLSESDVMRLICGAKLPQAIEFERWVFEDILPSIRKHNEITKMFNDTPVRIINQDGEPWFCLSDVCKILEIANARDCKNRLNPKGVATTDTLTNGGMQKLTFINESNLYKAIFQSRKKQAEAFADWVTEDVLPSIRKHGAYVSPNLKADGLCELLHKITSQFNELIQVNAEQREEIEYLNQFAPKGNYGEPSKANGLPRWQYRSGCIVSKNGKQPKRLSPKTNGFVQMELFQDQLPQMLIADTLNIINVNYPQSETTLFRP